MCLAMCMLECNACRNTSALCRLSRWMAARMLLLRRHTMASRWLPQHCSSSARSPELAYADAFIYSVHDFVRDERSLWAFDLLSLLLVCSTFFHPRDTCICVPIPIVLCVLKDLPPMIMLEVIGLSNFHIPSISTLSLSALLGTEYWIELMYKFLHDGKWCVDAQE